MSYLATEVAYGTFTILRPYGFAALNVVSSQLSTRLLEQPAHSQAQTGRSKAQRLQVAFAAHLKDIAQAYLAHTYPEVVITIDNASWYGGVLIRQVLEAHPHLCLKRLPSYSPQLNVIERFWRVLRRRATHNRLFTSMAALRRRYGITSVISRLSAVT